jgi:uncharacterized membrane protein
MNIKLLVTFSIVLILLDILWLQYFVTIIGPLIEKIQNSPLKLNPYGAVLAYIIMVISYYNLAYDGDKPNYIKGALLGLAIYGTYEFTNYATFSNWNLKVLGMDISWGIIISVLSLFLTDKIYSLIKN